MFEFVLAEWGKDPPTIMETWTEELLYLMVRKLKERKEREAAAIRGDGSIADATGVGDPHIPGVAYENESGE